MKVIPDRAPFPFRGLFTCAIALLFAAPTTHAQTLDIKDFLPLDPGLTWTMQGQASYLIFTITFPISITTEVGPVHHGVQTTRVVMNAYIDLNSYSLGVYQVYETLDLSLSGTHLLLHARTGQRWEDGVLKDEDIESYNTAARILPRLIEVGQLYNYTADLVSGSVNDQVLVAAIEDISAVGGQTMESVRLEAFPNAYQPIDLWMVRDMGFGRASFDADFDSISLTITALLQDPPQSYYGMKLAARWADSLALTGGWRTYPWLGNFWVPDADASWMRHEGLKWAYCQGDPGSFWMHLGTAGWVHVDKDRFPWIYDVTSGRYLYYLNKPDSRWVYDSGIGQWIELAP